ncbi:S1 family peptidase [Nostoc sp. UHCC 0870]|uniref:S1 family peptidase n=1 Tax=Nostoc sp. UHCC 0870 TaxID=2914041 RepID=UPI001EDFFBE5|nr:serine protease [Nostoc sp. UHCC 0870]UKO99313.1 serine protease [Nostoc sp. UHCC 0870]
MLLIRLGWISVGVGLLSTHPMICIAEVRPAIFTDVVQSEIKQIARQTTVRIFTDSASGSGVIVRRQGQIYTLLTSWHVVGFTNQLTIMTFDGTKHLPLTQNSVQVGKVDMAVVQFRSAKPYRIAAIHPQPVTPGELVHTAGFPMYSQDQITTTFDQGIRGFRFTQGVVSLLLLKSLYQGYRLGYTNNISLGMSGGPIFNQQGLLVGINGRVKNRDPDFGVYTFDDGTSPKPELLNQMVHSSWGIPITTYLQFISRK